MNSLLKYFILEYKKSIKIFLKSILSIVLMLLFLILGVAAVSFSILQSQVFEKIQVAVVIPENEKEVKLAASYISAMESVESICEFEYMDWQRADESIKNGSVQAIMTFPENFFEDVYVGENTPATIYLLDKNAHNAKVFQGLLQAGVSLLQISEAGVYATLYVAQEYGPMWEGGNLGDYMAGLYIKEVLQKDMVYEREIISATGTLKYGEYYFSAIMLIVLLMLGLNFGHLYEKHNKAVEQKLSLYGIHYLQLAGVRILIMSGIMWVVALLFVAGACVVDAVAGIGLPDFKIMLLPGLFLLCLSMATYFHAIYTICDDGIKGAVIVFALNIIMIIGSGVVLPVAYLPDVIGKIGKWMPLGMWSMYQNNLMFGTNSVMDVVWLGMIGFIGVGIGALLYEKRFDMV